MPYGGYVKCPCYGNITYDKDEIEKEFGYRDMGNDKIIPQSYCRACRSAHCEAWKPCKAQ